MTKMYSGQVSDDWWPSALTEFSKEQPLADEYVVVAELSSPWEPDSDKQLYTALVPTAKAKRLLSRRGGIAHAVQSSRPNPSPHDDGFHYTPSFWIHGPGKKDFFEPLVIRWESASKTVLLPDQGFLMTYGLVPRYCETGETFWDDPANRVFEVVRVEPPSEYHLRLLRASRVSIRREYLQDYATVRNMSLLQTYYVRNSDCSPDPLSVTLAGNPGGETKVPRRTLKLRPAHDNSEKVLAQVWGYRHLLDPGKAPVSIDEDYGVLNWPGYGTVDGRKRLRLHQLPPACEYVYVSDAVLGEYEGWPGFDISPETGAVGYEGQWSVSYCDRVGRDIIRVELKKLYEGNRPRTVKTWHKYCVAPPPQRHLAQLRKERNIAMRAKSVVYGMAGLGEALADIASAAQGTVQKSADIVSIDRAILEYHGWWKSDVIEPITRHAALGMHEGEFLARCVDLFKAVGEGLSERVLRKTLLGLGSDEKGIEKLRSLKLLERLVQMAMVADKSGLSLIRQGKEINARLKEQAPNTAVGILLLLSQLRNSKSHRDKNTKLAFAALGICSERMAQGWGAALDIVYDRTVEALSEITNALKAGMNS